MLNIYRDETIIVEATEGETPEQVAQYLNSQIGVESIGLPFSEDDGPNKSYIAHVKRKLNP